MPPTSPLHAAGTPTKTGAPAGGVIPVDSPGGLLPRHEAPVTITACPDGPLLVRGNAEIVDAQGRPLPRNRRTVALCRCGRSGLAPYCDGTHKVIGFRAPGDVS